MNIGLIYTSFYPPKKVFSASDRRVRDILRGINFHNNKSFLIVPRWKNSCAVNKDVNEFQIIYVGSKFDKIPGLNRLFFWVKLAFLARFKEIKTIIFYSPTIDCLFAVLLLRCFKILTIMEISDIDSYNFKKSIKGLLFYLGEIIIPKLTHGVIPISEIIEILIKKNTPNAKIYKVPILVDSDLFKASITKRNVFRKNNGISEDEIVIGYVGGMYKSYGVDLLIKAFGKVNKMSDKKLRLVIGGRLDNSPLIINAKDLVLENSIVESTILTGWAETELVLEILNASDILVIPHLNNEFNNAGLPTKLAEYAAIGKAVILTDVGDVKKYFKHKVDSYFIEGSNIDSMVEGMLEVINNNTLRNNLSIAIKETAIKYFDYKTNGKLICNYIQLLTKLNNIHNGL